jgi:hypothetical protein
MGKHVNPKTLKGQDKLNRMLDLMGKMNTLNESKSFSELELIKRGPNGIVYGIVRENHDYFIKTSNKPSGKFLAEDFNYIGGLKNKYDERYRSYAEALKHLNIKFDMLNESYGIKGNINIFESDGRAIAGGAGFGFVLEDEDEKKEDKEQIISDEKKVIKVDAPKTEEPVEDDVESEEPDVDMGGDIADVDFGDGEDTDTEDTDTEGEEGSDETTKKIQKLTGKIGQMLRDKEEVDPELEKYVINSIISALHLDDMDESDKEDIIAKIEGEETEGEETEEPAEPEGEETEEPAEPEGEETEEPAEPEGVELSEVEDKTKKSLEITPDMIAMLLKKGECECSGHKLVYKTKETKEETNESKIFSKKQLLESFLRNTTKKSLKKVLREGRNICERCMGAGCKSCINESSRGMCSECGGIMREGLCMECGLNENTMLREKHTGFKDGRKKIDRAKPYGKITSADFAALRKEGQKRDRRRYIDEDEMSTIDAMELGQGYLPTGDLDRDFDRIPNRLDLDNNSDGVLDFSDNKGDDFIDLDIDFLRNSEPGTKERERTTTRPGTKPGTGTDWDRIKRPKVQPKPKALGDEERIRPSYRRRGMFR